MQSKLASPSRQQGLTLIEVLVASILLFTAISITTLSYRTGIKAQISSQKHMQSMIALDFIRELIKEELRTKPQLSSGDGAWGDIEYSWSMLKQEKKWSKAGNDIETGQYLEFGRLLLLSDIVIEIENDKYYLSHLSWQ